VPDEVIRAMAREPIHHRGEEFREIFSRCDSRLRELFCTKGKTAILSATGTGAMEAAVVNTLKAGDKAVCIEGGKFGRRWSELCRYIGVDAIPIRVKLGESITPDRLKYTLKSYSDVKAVFLTQVESSTGALFDVPALSEAVHELSEAAVVADVVCSLGAEKFEQEKWGVDVAVGAIQKALMCPPGMALVSVSDKGKWKLRRVETMYWDLDRYFHAAKTNDPPFTPAINLFFALDKALEIIFERGLETVHAETEWLGKTIREIIEKAGLKIFPDNPANGMSVIELPEGINDKDVINRLEAKTGFRISGGQDELAGKILRISHMGAVKMEDLKKLIPKLFGVLKELGWKGDTGEVSEGLGKEYDLFGG